MLGIRKVDFGMTNPENTDSARFEQFDAVFYCDTLYRLPEPWKLIEQIKSISNRLFIWIHNASEDKAGQKISNFYGLYYEKNGFNDSLSGLCQSFLPALQLLQNMLKQHDFMTLKTRPNNPFTIRERYYAVYICK